MTEPRRLFSEGAGELERGLRRAWQSRQPSDASRARALAIVGLGVGLGTVAAGTSASAASVATVAAGAAGAGAQGAVVAAGVGGSIAPKAIVVGALLKWLAIGAIGAASVAAVIGYTRLAGPTETHASLPTTAQHIESTLPASPAVARADAPPATGAASPPPALIATSRSVARPPFTAQGAAPAKSTLDEEVAAIDAARQSVTSGDAPTALRLLDGYDAKHPGGALAQESTELRIEALVQNGSRATAERLAARFIEAHPASPYVRRIHAVLDGAPAP